MGRPELAARNRRLARDSPAAQFRHAPLNAKCVEPSVAGTAPIGFTLPRAGGSDAIASGESCLGVIAPRVPPLRHFGPTLPEGRVKKDENHALS